MHFKTAIILSILTVSTTTLAAPVNHRGSELSRPEDNLDIPHRHHARDLEEVQEIEARSPSPDEQDLEARSPFKIKSDSTGLVGDNGYGSPLNTARQAFFGSGPKAQTAQARQNIINGVRQARTRSPSRVKPSRASAKGTNAFTRYSAAILRGHKPRPNRENPLARIGATASRTRYARGIPEDAQELEARSPSSDEQDPQVRSPINPSGVSHKATSAFTRYAAAIVKGHKPRPNRGNPLASSRARSSRKIRYARNFPEDVQELEARSPKVKAPAANNKAPSVKRPQARSLPEDMQEVEARSLTYELDEIDA